MICMLFVYVSGDADAVTGMKKFADLTDQAR